MAPPGGKKVRLGEFLMGIFLFFSRGWEGEAIRRDKFMKDSSMLCVSDSDTGMMERI